MSQLKAPEITIREFGEELESISRETVRHDGGIDLNFEALETDREATIDFRNNG